LSADKKKEKCPEPIPTGNFIFSASGIVLFFGAILLGEWPQNQIFSSHWRMARKSNLDS